MRLNKALRYSLVICFSICLSLGTTLNAQVDRIVAFGDSLSDNGNVLGITGVIGGIPQPPYFGGRLTNGPVWLEVLAQRLGVDIPQPFVYGGTNYAIAAAESDFDPGWGMQLQILLYLLDNTPASETDLFLVWGGANDLRNGETDSLLVAQQIVGNVLWLYSEGARKFVVPNVPPLGETPEAIAQGTTAELNALSAEFNFYLEFLLDVIESDPQFSGIEIVRVDVATFFNQAIATPAVFGFTNTVDPAWTGDLVGNGSLVSNPNEYLFWDFIHPTATAHWWLGQVAGDQVETQLGLAP